MDQEGQDGGQGYAHVEQREGAGAAISQRIAGRGGRGSTNNHIEQEEGGRDMHSENGRQGAVAAS